MGKRQTFSSNLGFILATAGAAVGLGNLWRFPYLAAKFGGGAFLLIYFIFVVTLGFTLLVAEITIGRKTQLSPSVAYGKLHKSSNWLGVLTIIIGFIILPYYSLITGWIIKYFLTYLSGNGVAATADTYFESFIGHPWQPIFFQILVILFALFIVWRGLKNGVEKANKIFMPILLVLAIIIAIYSISLDGAQAGVKYFLIPDFSRLTAQGVLAALGQMFYSLSLAMGITITYGSYLAKEHDIEQAVWKIASFDTIIAILAGLMIIPAVFAFSGGNEAALNVGAGLMFVTLPKVFANMGVLPNLIGALFFMLAFFAAITSIIAFFETLSSSLCDKFHITRKKALLIVAGIAILLGIPNSLGYGAWSGFQPLNLAILDFMDFLSNSVLMPICAFCTCIFIGYIIKPKTIIDEVKISSQFIGEKIFVVMIRYIAPIAIIAILIFSVLSGLGIWAV